MGNEYVIKSTNVYNTGGGCLVMFMDVSKQLIVNGNQPELKQISYDGDTFAGTNLRYEDAEEGIQPENVLWVADRYEDLVDILGIDLVLSLRKQIIENWKYTDSMHGQEFIISIEKLIAFTDATSQLFDGWSTELDQFTHSYPFADDFESVLIDIVNWQQSVLSKYRK